MRIIIRAFLFVLGLNLLAGSGLAQRSVISSPTPGEMRTIADDRQRKDAANQEKILETLKTRNENMLKPPISAEERALRVRMEAEKIEAVKEINEKFFVSREYHIRYAEFLKNKNTGIARMFPDKNCGKGLTVSVDELERCADAPQIVGAGSFYSVRLNKIPADLSLNYILSLIGKSDIHFVGDKFIVGNQTTQSVISEIGDVNLADIDAKSDAFKFLRQFKPSKNKSELDAQNRTLSKGYNDNGYLYAASAPVKLNSVYVLRSIAFREGYETFWNTDILVAFKVIGQEKDGSVVILWRKLKEKDAPFLENK